MARTLTIRTAGLVAALSAVGAGATAADPAPLTFAVQRDGTPIGTHRVSFRRTGDRLEAEIAIDFEVKLAFVTVYRYTHRSREVWSDGRLVALDARTNDNGERTEVRARATAQGLAVEGSGGSFVAPATTMPTSYWHEEMTRRRQLLDTQAGRLVDVSATAIGSDRITIAGHVVETRGYRLRGDLVSDISYSASGEWVALAFTTRGSRITYRRDAPPAATAVSPFATGRRAG